MMGAEKHHDHKDLIKFLRKSFGVPKQTEQVEGEEKKEDGVKPVEIELPLKAVCKKRNSNFAFLEFKDAE